MSMYRSSFIVCVLVIFGCATFAQAEKGRRPHRSPMYQQVVEGAEKTWLSQDKIAEISMIADTAQPVLEQLRETVDRERGELNRLMDEDPINQDAIADQVELIVTAEKSSRIEEVKVLLDIRILLTKDEWQTIKATIKRPKRGRRGKNTPATED